MTDLLELTAELVAMPSESFHEAAIVAWLERELRAVDGLEVTRVGDNLVARTTLGRPERIVLAGHTDTVPENAGNGRARIEGDTLWGLGAADMKSGLAVMLELARTVPDPAVDVTYVFYAREEVAAEHSGLGELARERPDLLAGDLAVLGEGSRGGVEAGCQGTLRVEVRLAGARSHTARPWMGRNAVHRLGPLLDAVAAVPERRPVLAGCEYREALQAVRVEGGVAGNVVPDLAVLTLNHRFAPDRTEEEAAAFVRSVVAPFVEDGDEVVVVDSAPAAAPAVDHPRLARVIADHALEVRSKLGWTDVARFAALGIPAVNIGPGDPSLAHTVDERVERAPLEATHAALRDLIG
ncbi:MAG TPA: succinyl-diaminopimelate desuccinylase [Iamia sp.]|nr:succinyl-diaminopimelate desuccinylase [Iamia sp.]